MGAGLQVEQRIAGRVEFTAKGSLDKVISGMRCGKLRRQSGHVHAERAPGLRHPACPIMRKAGPETKCARRAAHLCKEANPGCRTCISCQIGDTLLGEVAVWASDAWQNVCPGRPVSGYSVTLRAGRMQTSMAQRLRKAGGRLSRHAPRTRPRPCSRQHIGAPAEVKGEARVVSIANGAPAQSASPLAALVLPGGINIKVTEPDVHGHRGTGLSANAGCSTLEGPAPGTKDA